jgi:hypothetical protein
MEPKVSLQCSQKPITGTCSEPHELYYTQEMLTSETYVMEVHLHKIIPYKHCQEEASDMPLITPTIILISINCIHCFTKDGTYLPEAS